MNITIKSKNADLKNKLIKVIKSLVKDYDDFESEVIIQEELVAFLPEIKHLEKKRTYTIEDKGTRKALIETFNKVISAQLKFLIFVNGRLIDVIESKGTYAFTEKGNSITLPGIGNYLVENTIVNQIANSVRKNC